MWFDMEDSFDPRTVCSRSDVTGIELVSTENAQCIDNHRFARACLAAQDRETIFERQGDLVDNREITDM
jgi:hypothetical protein